MQNLTFFLQLSIMFLKTVNRTIEKIGSRTVPTWKQKKLSKN